MAELLARWREGLSKTSASAFGRVATVLGATEINERLWAELEDLLIQADLGIQTTSELLAALRASAGAQGLGRADSLRDQLRRELRGRLAGPPTLDFGGHPAIILVIGINGSGKTTTIAKLARFFQVQGRSVLLAAADTFRAAATDQIEVWAQRLKIDVIAGAAESDPAAVAFNAVQAAVARGTDVVLIDTAGRLHTRSNLMEELKKVHRVVGKAQAGAPHAVLLVLDATTGQNALAQARGFKDAVGVDGIILAKLDASARGGMVFAVQRELALPILFVGLGESVEDLQPFDPDAFVNGILA